MVLNNLQVISASGSGTVLGFGKHVLGKFLSNMLTLHLAQAVQKRRNASLNGWIVDGEATQLKLPREVPEKGTRRMFKWMFWTKPVA